jgi:hypothetical protein
MIENLFGPFNYLRIRHAFKRNIDWYVPLVLTLISMGSFLFLDSKVKIDIFSSVGLSNRILGFVQILPGFYIAALAAIATFNKTDIDFVMPAPAPRLNVEVQGRSFPIDLTRRRFLCSMFAFLTAESLVIIFLTIVGGSIAPSLKEISPISLHAYLVATYVFVTVFLCWQLVVATFWGLYYLGDRLHQPTREDRTLPS